MTKSEELAEIVVDRCLEIGVREFVVCAGSRNSPLVLELLRRGDEVRVWSFFEERCASFFGLGRSRALGAPVAVVTTSGTAAAELFPAVIESHYQRTPLLCITADRPRSFRGTGAPQAIEQAGMYGGYVSASWDIEADFIVAGYDGANVFWDDSDEFTLTNWDGYGPAQLNVCFCEPLLSAERRDRSRSGIRENFDHPQAEILTNSATISPTRLLVMLGSLTQQQQPLVLDFLTQQFDAVILADATSGLLNHEDLSKRTLFGGEGILKTWRPESVLRIGGVPSCRFWRDLEDLSDIPVVSALSGGFSGLARESTLVDSLDQIQIGSLSSEFGQHVLSLDVKRAYSLVRAINQHPAAEPAMIHNLSCEIPRGSLVFLGNSMPIREWNLTAARESHKLSIFANRGANGIDGNLSTFLGLAADVDEAWCVIGDLTALYDLAAPAILQQLPTATKLRIVIINNGGGRIFSRLPVLGDLSNEQKAVTENHHDVRFGAWAEMWGLAYQVVTGGGEYPENLPDRLVLELRPDAEQTEAFWRDYHALPGDA